MSKPMHRIRISGQIHYHYEQTIELSDEEFVKFRNQLNIAKKMGDKAIDDCLGTDYGDVEPIDGECSEWSAELIDKYGKIIEHLDAN